ncbi:hypothetical protein THASP1DRAFT_28987 [Thamnocephalis sphaerospora]|uniref:F-box domain-containing protein n=1 Tax=Thamnocephalis sphaerospora TaxID=78915 RepID=A0A4P9XSU4_9FUNG|nr:hypothetical protein THASP1DRAFT_28987 [Thamnocephalis sphaerospora]|eukprot:RKP09214.1 hypothetical protein THASP1DRAFT_28987 [Thamnocephalis sphaerospora]
MNSSNNTKTGARLRAQIPAEVFRRLLFCLDARSALKVGSTCRFLYTMVAFDNGLWRHFYKRAYPLLCVERSWLEVHSDAFRLPDDKTSRCGGDEQADGNKAAAGAVTAPGWENIDWQLAFEHRKRTESNWRKKRYIGYMDRVGDVPYNTYYQQEVAVFAGPAGVLMVDRRCDVLSFVSAVAGGRIQLLRMTEADYREGGDEDESDVVLGINAKVLVGSRYILAIGALSNTSHTADIDGGFSVATLLAYREDNQQLLVWRAHNLQSHAMLTAPRGLTLGEISGGWLHAWYDQSDDSRACSESNLDSADGAGQFVHLIYDLDRACVAWTFRSETSTSCHIQQTTCNSVMLFRSRIATSPQRMLMWQLWRIQPGQQVGTAQVQLHGHGSFRLDAHYTADVKARRIDDSHILLGRHPKDTADYYTVLKIFCAADRHLWHNAPEADTTMSATHGGDRNVSIRVLWARLDSCRHLLFPDLGRILLGTEEGEWQLLDLYSGEQAQGGRFDGVEKPQRILGSLCLAKVNDSICLLDVLGGEILHVFDDVRGDLPSILAGTQPNMLSYWMRHGSALRTIDFNSLLQ